MESVDELTSKLSLFEGQLSEVEDCLLLDPSNDQFLKIREDLRKVIFTLKDVLQNHDKSNQQEESGDRHDEDDSEDDSDDDNDAESAFVRHTPRPAALTGVINVGEVIEVIGGDRPYAGFVTDIVDAGSYRVKYFEYGDTEVTLPVANLVRIQPGVLIKEDISVGFKCQCKYSEDQKLYDVVVSAINEQSVTVKYLKYGNSEEVPVEYLKPHPPKEKKQSSGLIKIPDNLKILATDTEEEKQRKKKRIKAIKSKNRLVTKEIEVTAVKNTWQKFVTKASKKSFSTVGKESMFKSPDEIEGKVGVTNSGKGTTGFAQRKKHKF